MVTTILSWVLTYALHSTVLILCVWLVCRLVPRLSLATQELLWKVALGGALVTSTVQLGVGVQPPWGHFAMPQALATDAATSVAPVPTTTAPTTIRHRAGELTIVATRTTSTPSVASAAPPPASPISARWPWILLSIVTAGSVLGVVRVALAARALRRQLAHRRDVIEDPLLESWLALCNKAQLTRRVRLSAAASLPSPIALVRREVCVPERAIDGLTPAQQESMLAHELAHVLRRDPAWLVAATVVEAVLFFQPLHHLVRRKLEEVAEFQCDDWAARHAGTGVHLAKCLAEVAAWVERQPPMSMVATMASSRSPIVRRITRLLDDRCRAVNELNPGWRIGASLGLLGAVAWLAPGVARSADVSPAQVRVSGVAAAPRIVVEDIDGNGLQDRARVRIVGADDTVEFDVAAPRRLPPPPPPAPPAPPTPPPRSSELRIVIEGGWAMDAWPFGGPMGGFIGIELDGLDMLFEDEPFEDEPFDVHAAEAATEAAALRAAEHALRQAERTRRDADRAERHGTPSSGQREGERRSWWGELTAETEPTAETRRPGGLIAL